MLRENAHALLKAIIGSFLWVEGSAYLGEANEGVGTSMKPKCRVNGHCPYCREEHLWMDIFMTDEEQREYDEFYTVRPRSSILDDAFGEAPLTVMRKVHCSICGKNFSQAFRICKSIETSNMQGVGEFLV